MLLEKGASFDNAFASYPLCCPLRATILTGLYAHNHEVKGNLPPDGGFEKFRDEGLEGDTIATLLQEEGYRTGLFGKYLNGYGKEDPTYVPPGWDEWHVKLDKQKAYRTGSTRMARWSPTVGKPGATIPTSSPGRRRSTSVAWPPTKGPSTCT